MPMRIARVVPSLPPMEQAYGYYVTFHMLTKAQTELGNDVTTVAQSGADRAKFPGGELPVPPYLPGDLGTGARLVRAAKNFDVVHAHARSGLGYALFRRNGPPLVVHLHGLPYNVTDPMGGNGQGPRMADPYDVRAFLSYKALLERADHVITYCRGLASRVVELFALDAGLVTAVDNGVEPRYFSPDGGDARDLLGLKDEPVLIYVGRFSQVKGINHLLEAVPALLRKIPEIRLLFLGCEHRDLGAYERQFPDNIAVIPHVPHSQAGAYYRAATAHVALSLVYGYQKTVLESLASGIPVVATNNADNRRVIGEAGVYIDPLRVEDIVAGVEAVITEPRYKRRARKASSRILQGYTWRKTAKRIQHIYDGVVHQRT